MKKLLLGDVARDDGCPDDLSLCVPDWRPGKTNRDRAAVFPQKRNFDRVQRLPAFYNLEPRPNILSVFGRQKHGYVFPDDFLARVAAQKLRGAVPARDGSIQPHSMNRLIGRLHDRRQQPLGLFGFTLSGNVAGDDRDGFHVSRGSLNRPRRNRDMDDPSVLADAPSSFRVEGASIDDLRRVLIHLGQGGREDQHGKRSADRLAGLITKNGFCAAVPGENRSRWAVSKDRIFGALHHGGEKAA
jgi:hypothetical protein